MKLHKYKQKGVIRQRKLIGMKTLQAGNRYYKKLLKRSCGQPEARLRVVDVLQQRLEAILNQND